MAQVETIKVEPDEAGMRLDRWFHQRYPDLSFGHLQKLLRSGQVRVDGARVKTNTRVEPGQAVRVPPLGPREAPGDAGGPTPAPRNATRINLAKATPAKDLDDLRGMTLYEDDAVMVLDKPPGLSVHGGSGVTRHIDAMLEAMRDDKDRKPRLVHRLDRETSGVLVVARTRAAASALAASFRSRSAKKVYWALVAGVPKPKQGRVSTWLARDPDDHERMAVAEHGDDEAAHAVSLYSVVDQAGSKLAWLTMKPVTGRTHQLRAHAAHIGHPIVGDPRYFDRQNWELPGGIQNRLHLQAHRIVMPHPDGGVIDVTAPLPAHMLQSWNLLGFDVSAGGGADEDDE